MQTSIAHFQHVVERIRANSWFGTAVLRDGLQFQITVSNGHMTITDVPEEAFESLLLHVRKLTMNDSPEQLHRVHKQLKATAANELDRHLLDIWRKYWRLTLIKEPFLLTSPDGTRRQVVTPYLVYDAFVNGYHFHTNCDTRNVLLYGGQPTAVGFDPHLFLKYKLHSTVCQLAFAALGLDQYIRNNHTFVNLPIMGTGVLGGGIVLDFMWYRLPNKEEFLDEQYRIFNEWIIQEGGTGALRWT
jgi:hypothetical protein